MFDISAYHFYKLIEMAIKLEKDFPRGIIKHLNRVCRLAYRKRGGANIKREFFSGGGNGAESASLDFRFSSL